MEELSLVLNTKITNGRDLLFLDEIQACPEAISALRYFYEKCPELHVIAAGSLIEFALESEKFSMPVGRVQSLFLYPMSFCEFLLANGQELLVESLSSWSLQKPPSPELHKKYLSWVRKYSVVGGMPAAVRAYAKEESSLEYQNIQSLLNQSFRDDFSKYSTVAKHKYLEAVIQSAPRLMCTSYKYSNVDKETPSRSIKDALSLLEKAGILNRICATSGHGIPLEVNASKTKFKIAHLDLGLAQRALGLDAEIAMSSDFTAVNSGSNAEQFVAQELIASANPYEKKSLYYWARDKPNSSAEVDYLFQKGDRIYPLEVKAGATGSLKSLRIFLEEHPAPFGLRVSEHGLSYVDRLLSVPFYLVSELNRLISEV